jgi:hypothetical protein
MWGIYLFIYFYFYPVEHHKMICSTFENVPSQEELYCWSWFVMKKGENKNLLTRVKLGKFQEG